MRAFAKHAAGVVVGGEPLINRAVLETRDEEGIPVVNRDKRVVEDWGLVKMDILGLSTLDVLEIARHYIKERHGRNISYISLPLEEPDFMDSFGRGDTTGVFQFESPGMKKLLRDLAQGATDVRRYYRGDRALPSWPDGFGPDERLRANQAGGKSSQQRPSEHGRGAQVPVGRVCVSGAGDAGGA